MPAPNSPNSGFAAACEPETGSSDEHEFHVLICEEQSSRVQLISRVVVEGGAQPLQVIDSSALTKLPSLQCFIALVGFAGCPAANAPALNTVRALVNSGLIVMCYADHVRTWPLGKRCNVLLAGALRLFDSAMPEFSQELKRALTEVLRLQSAKRDEDARMKSEIRKLGLIGESRVMLSIFRWVQKASALSDLPALITGETGTGKELLVNAIHRLDRKRSTGPLVALNCGAITAGVAESELFGHRRGAFTGAERHRKGLIRAANGGILFLDEIGDLDCSLQSKLLRVLQESRVLGVGEDRELPINVRVIAATNRNLKEMVGRGAFRDDLFHRLNILSVHIPALRQRPADLKPLVQHFVEKHRNLSSATRLSVDPEFIEALAQLELPGNAREVENLVRRALVNKITDSPLTLSDLPPEVLGKLAEQKADPPFSNDRAGAEDQPDRLPYLPGAGDYDEFLFKLLQLNKGSLAQTLQQCERVLIASALEHSHGNQSLVAKSLGITPRSVYNKLRKHHLR
jgi:transcriptional regulator with PAS, ATPase and Fis domain